jgi:hypothetical protein
LGTYSLRVRFLILGPYETALDTHGAVMVEDHKSLVLDAVYQILVLRAFTSFSCSSWRRHRTDVLIRGPITRLTRGLYQRL